MCLPNTIALGKYQTFYTKWRQRHLLVKKSYWQKPGRGQGQYVTPSFDPFQSVKWSGPAVHPPDDGPAGPGAEVRAQPQAEGPRGLRQLDQLQRLRKPARVRLGRLEDLHLGLAEEAEGLLLQVRPQPERFPVQVFALHGWVKLDLNSHGLAQADWPNWRRFS